MNSHLQFGSGTNNINAAGDIFFQFDPLYIEDPLSPGNNIGRNTFRINTVLKAFGYAYSLLEAQLRRSEATGQPSPLLDCLFE